MNSDIYSNDRINFVTLFPEAEAFHLSKDVGQIPYIFAKQFKVNALLVTESNGPFSDLNQTTPGLRICRLKSSARFLGMRLSALSYVWRESRKIDVLNLYHLSLETKLLSLLYRMRNPKGFLYVKLDVNVANEVAALQQSPRRNPLRRFFGRVFHAAFYRAVNVVSGESNLAVDVVRQRYPLLTNKVMMVTNGLEVDALPQNVQTTLALKQKLIITVGRIGSFEKNNELLLEALKPIDLQGWKVAIIGPYTDEFAQRFTRFLEENPNFKNSVELVGNVRDRNELMNWYARSRILAMTSRWEGFPLVYAEAQCCGNFILSTEVSSANEVTEYGEIGRVVPNGNIEAYTQALRDLIDDCICQDELLSRIATEARARYDWRHVLSPLKIAIDKHYDV